MGELPAIVLQLLFALEITFSVSNNSIQFFIIYLPSQQMQGQLQTQHSVDTGNHIMDKHDIKTITT
jgi:hypothetical protein